MAFISAMSCFTFDSDPVIINQRKQDISIWKKTEKGLSNGTLLEHARICSFICLRINHNRGNPKSGTVSSSSTGGANGIEVAENLCKSTSQIWKKDGEICHERASLAGTRHSKEPRRLIPRSLQPSNIISPDIHLAKEEGRKEARDRGPEISLMSGKMRGEKYCDLPKTVKGSQWQSPDETARVSPDQNGSLPEVASIVCCISDDRYFNDDSRLISL
ncbi:hypothetical protein Y1Q_0006013 [Alligator mississippiensis]|uniref:Uncharacterized protein n=1 Tax=Alligator mississippiensis TaxID=8496 RepID=A0A151N3R7_ALLMI|nr:hypothetical protein Y1Q_0006013 [Alligator mississippiensis]